LGSRKLTVLSLDLSTKSGWALAEFDYTKEKPLLVDYGATKKIAVKDSQSPIELYGRAWDVVNQIDVILEQHKPNCIVIESVNRGRARFSQLQLDFIHFAIIHELLGDYGIDAIKYIDTSKWRKTLELKLSKEDKINNKKWKDYRINNFLPKPTKGKGKKTWKHLSVEYVNKTYNKEFKQKDNDICDAICLLDAYFKMTNNGL
jgi:hypothetical protein